MARREVIETLLAEAAGMTVRTFTPAQIDDVAGAFSRQFEGTADQVLIDAFDSWQSSFGEKPPPALPTPAQIWAHHAKAGRARPPDSVATEYERPRIEFVKAHLGARDKIRRIQAEKTERKHEHRDPTWDPGTMTQITTGTEDCEACHDSARRRAAIDEVLAGLPEPAEGRPRCRCGDSGSVETKEPNRVGQPQVYPCPDCNFDAFHQWRFGHAPENAA